MKEKVFRSFPAQGALGALSGMHGVFNKRGLPSTFRGLSKAIALTFNVLEVSGTDLTNNSIESFLCLVISKNKKLKIIIVIQRKEL